MHRVKESYSKENGRIQLLVVRVILKYHLGVIYRKLRLDWNQYCFDENSHWKTKQYWRPYKRTISERRMEKVQEFKHQKLVTIVMIVLFAG